MGVGLCADHYVTHKLSSACAALVMCGGGVPLLTRGSLTWLARAVRAYSTDEDLSNIESGMGAKEAVKCNVCFRTSDSGATVHTVAACNSCFYRSLTKVGVPHSPRSFVCVL